MSNSASRDYVVLSAVGTDRPGIVAEVTEFLSGRGCNVEESRMAILGGEFGLLMLLSGTTVEALDDEISKLAESSGLEIRIRSTAAPELHRQTGAVPYLIKTYAADHEGIIHAISRSLTRLGVNIVSASTSSHPAPISGTPLFQMDMEVDVPQSLNLNELRNALDQVATEENADIELSFVEGGH
ncbi:MAG: ACT domain-containing protein [Planctomycetota bacterium]|jgi:glycine cleavage system transcriptional repressor|nr:ACT domain-containing protein [Planctomycetota bacterium]MDP7252963.1 ACT domain-containing protein [Planctomycetota bacterium]